MGVALSCLDPSRNENGVNMEKKHPGRAEAIAEYKARKRSSNAQPPVTPANKVDEPTEAKPLDPEQTEETVKLLPENEDKEKEVEPDADTNPEDGDTKKPLEEKDEDEDETKPLVETKEITADEETGNTVDDVVKDVEPNVEDETIKEEPDNTPDATSTKNVEEPVVDVTPATEEPEAVGETKSEDVEPEAIDEIKTDDVELEGKEVNAPGSPPPVEEEVKTETETPKPVDILAVEDSDDITAKAEPPAAEIEAVSPLISMRKAVFEQANDDIPEAKALKRDIQDPVTGEMVTLEEYRNRQADRAQGVVKEHVEKYEELDDVAAKESETHKLQLTARAQGREVRSWSTPVKGASQPSSPIEPRKMSNNIEDLIPSTSPAK